MAVSADFREFVLAQLGELPSVSGRAMFGGHGIYSAGVFFAVMDNDRLYFYVNSETIGSYLDAGMGCFCPMPDMQMKTYYEVPPAVLESGVKLCDYARQSVAAAAKKPRKKASRKAKNPRRTTRS